jgi:hypothetical protein
MILFPTYIRTFLYVANQLPGLLMGKGKKKALLDYGLTKLKFGCFGMFQLFDRNHLQCVCEFAEAVDPGDLVWLKQPCHPTTTSRSNARCLPRQPAR